MKGRVLLVLTSVGAGRPGGGAHVRGEVVDVGPEPWHVERLAGAIGSRCPEREPHA